jgi:hypothetical protein
VQAEAVNLSGRVGSLVFVLMLSTLGFSTGCSSKCGASCGSGVVVWWKPGAVPRASSYRLCVNDTCEKVRPGTRGAAGRYNSVSPASATADRTVAVRLELLDATGAPTKRFTGGGTKTGQCCAVVELQAEPDGRLVVAHSD